jgi:hypothetical protein
MIPEVSSPDRKRSILIGAFAVLLSLFVCGRLADIVRTTQWTMDADESVHAVEALRLTESLEEGRLLDFLRDSYFPERWHPTADSHLRWYPPVHAWCVAPLFAIFGASDFTARLPSVAFLFGTALLFFALARRLARGAPRGDPAMSGLVAVALLLSSPNQLTFSAQSLVASAAVFFCFLALLAYLRSLEQDHPRGRALLAGFLLGIAILTKYDHGGILALCLGISELWRVRFRARALWRGGAPLLFAVAGAMVLAWFAHPDKLVSLLDSVRHPFLGSPRTIFLDFFLTWIVEYAPGLAAGVLAFGSGIALRKRLADPAIRAVWIWAVFSAVFYVLRGRYHFRYNIVEAPIFLLMLAVVLPEWVRSGGARLADPAMPRRTAVGLALWLVGAIGVIVGIGAALAPDALFDLLRTPAYWFWNLREGHWGMQRPASEYVDYYAAHYADFVVWFGGSLASTSIGIFVVGAATLLWRYLPATRRHATVMVSAALVVAIVPGAVQLHSRLAGMVDWELEGHPELAQLHAFIIEHAPPGQVVLLGGGWDQLTNNSLRWYRASRSRGARPPLGAVEVTGDMIGSVVIPPKRRIAWWAKRLAGAPADELPRRIVLVEPGPRFLYRALIGPEVAIYEEIVGRRGSFEELADGFFPALDCHVRILRREGHPPPVEPPWERMEAVGLIVDGSWNPCLRVWVGEGGWLLHDDSLRHYIAR